MNFNQESIESTNNKSSKAESTKEIDIDNQDSSISKENIPSFNKILIADDGKDGSNKVVNYAISLSNYSGAELLILRILENIEKMEDVSVEGSSSNTTDVNMNDKDVKREVKGEIIDNMEGRIKRCKEAGCQNKISYKFRTGDAIDEIVNEAKEGKYDLILLKSSNIDSWMKSLFSDTRKILGNITIPVLIVQ